MTEAGGKSKTLTELVEKAKSAAETLFKLLSIGNNDNVLDLGCGVGNLTRKIREMTKGEVVGVDPSRGMIREAISGSRSLNITFEVRSAEELEYENRFDVIFCNSAFQWFRYPQRAIERCYDAMRKNARIGIQAPAKPTPK
jgi:ubiquinone/menaquinone biosynthesis C-methylase UbiE